MVYYAESPVRLDFYIDSTDKAKFVSREWGLVEIGKENESAVLVVVKNSGTSLKYIPSGWKTEKFKIDCLPFYSRGLGELLGTCCVGQREQTWTPPWPGVWVSVTFPFGRFSDVSESLKFTVLKICISKNGKSSAM